MLFIGVMGLSLSLLHQVVLSVIGDGRDEHVPGLLISKQIYAFGKKQTNKKNPQY